MSMTDARIDTVRAASAVSDGSSAATAASSATPSVVPLDPLRRYCHGRAHQSGVFPEGYWLIPTGKTIRQDTRCGFCQDVLDIHDGVVATKYHNINCNSGDDAQLTSVQHGGIRVNLNLLHDNTVPLFLDPENRVKAQSGVGIFVAPTQTEFEILISLAGASAAAFAAAGTFNTFTIEEALAGEEKIVINNGQVLYYDSGRAVIKAFATGSDRSFLFVSPSEWEKANASEARVAATMSESNIFTLKIQPYKRTSPVVHQALYRSGPKGSKGLSRSSESSWGDESMMEVQCMSLSSNSAGGGARGDSRGGGGGGDSLGYAKESFSSSRGPATGGATVSGGTHVGHVETRALTDKYDKVGEPVIIKIQLVCRQPDEHKKVDNLRARLQQDGFDYRSLAVKEQLAKKERLLVAKERLQKEIDTVHQAWSEEVVHLSQVLQRNQPLLAQLSPEQLLASPLNSRATPQVKLDNQKADEARKNGMLLDV